MDKAAPEPVATLTSSARDREPRLRSLRPPYESLRPQVRLVDLFCGCGAMSLGVAEAAWHANRGIDVRLAMDIDPDASAVFRANFGSASVATAPVEEYFDGDLESTITSRERQVRALTGPVDILLGGPPCQGHSNLNNHTRRSDPRNLTYLKMARAARVLRPKVVLIENVPMVRHDVQQVVKATIEALRGFGYAVGDRVIDVSKLGVPQRRKRHVVLAFKGKGLKPSDVLDHVASTVVPQQTVRDAIEDLLQPQPETQFDTASQPYTVTQARMDWLIENDKYDLPNTMRPLCHASDHSYYAMYGRLRWDQAAQTITTGFNCMGQGRYVHPSRARTITPHEAARLQSIPDFWDLSAASTRNSLARLIGNAVPPPLSQSIMEGIFHLCPTLFLNKEASSIRSSQTTPRASSPQARARMQSVRQRDTAAEIAVRQELDQLGLSYTIDERLEPSVRRRADIVFRDSRVAVFVDGCFWHSCPTHATKPKSNTTWWADKLKANQQRDRDTDALLSASGWKVLRFWAHEPPEAVAQAVVSAIKRGPSHPQRTNLHRKTQA